MSNINAIVLGETGSGKSTFLNSIIKNYGNQYDRLLKTSDDTDECTTDIEPVNIFYNNIRFTFYDCPGLNDGNSENNKNYIKSLRDEGKDPKNRINCILLCINSQCPRFNQGIKEVIIEIMNCYPLKKFWEHVIIIKTRVFNDNFKKPGNIENAIKKNKDVIEAMSIKSIDSPYNIKEFYFNLVDDFGNYKTDKSFKEKMNSLLEEVSIKKPFFKDIKILGTEDKEVNNYIITFQKVLYIDFNGKSEEKLIEIDRKSKVKII